MGQQYNLTFVNNSLNNWDFCVYQQDPSIGTVPNPAALAWFAKQIDKGSNATFTWTIDYGFTWFEAGTTAGGAVKYVIGQTVDADLSTQNQITLSYDGAFEFGIPTENTSSGTIFIKEDGTVPSQTGYVGISMSGNGTFAVPAEPNIHLSFMPDPEYWCTFGTYEVGQVMSIGEVTSPQQVSFNGVTSVTVTLNADNTWTVS